MVSDSPVVELFDQDADPLLVLHGPLLVDGVLVQGNLDLGVLDSPAVDLLHLVAEVLVEALDLLGQQGDLLLALSESKLIDPNFIEAVLQLAVLPLELF